MKVFIRRLEFTITFDKRFLCVCVAGKMQGNESRTQVKIEYCISYFREREIKKTVFVNNSEAISSRLLVGLAINLPV